MTAQEVLSYLSRQGIELWMEGDKLRYRGVKRTLPPPLVALLRQHKTELQRLLQERKKNPAAPFPLSFTQKAFWFLYQLNPTSSAYNGALAMALHGPVSPPALKRAFEQLCQRHPILRTRLIIYDGGPWQEVDSRPVCSLEVIDAAAWTKEALREHIQAEAHRPFELLLDAPARVQLYQRSAEECVLFLCMHHIHIDGWSIGILLRDFGALYRSAVSGHPVQLPTLPVSYSDFVSHQQQLLLSVDGEAHLGYWMGELAGPLPVLDLPVDYPRPKTRSERGTRILWTFDTQLAQSVKMLAAGEGTTLNVVLLSAFAVLLRRYSGQAEFLIGSPYHGRSEPQWGNVMGCFVNSMALRMRFPPGLTFRSLLSDVRQRSHEALAHADYPFPLLVERLRPEREQSHTPLFQVMFAYDNYQGADLMQPAASGPAAASNRRLGFGVSMEPWPLSQQDGQFDLTLSAGESGGTLHCSLSYSTDLFTHQTIQKMAGHFEELLRSAAADPQREIDSLPLLSAAEQHQLLHDFNPEPLPLDMQGTFPALFQLQAARTPDAPAVVYQSEVLSYSMLTRRAAQLAHKLRAIGVGPEVRVGVCLDRSAELLVGIVGVWFAGGAFVPLEPLLPQDRLEFILQDAAAPVVVTQRHYESRFPRPGVQLVFMEDLAPTLLPAEPPVNDLLPQHLAYCIYTSGSTGRPRGVLVEQGSMIHLAQTLHSALVPPPASPLHVSVSASIGFDAAIDQLLLLLGGACLHILPDATRMDAAALVHYARARQLDLIDCTPTMLTELIAHGLLAEPQCAPAWLWVGGEALPEPLWNALRAASTTRSINLYGPTEATVDSTFCELRPGPARPVIGKPFGHVRVYILDEQRNLLPIGVPGEIYLSGPGVARGYLNQPQLTEQKFLPDPFMPGERMYQTGDRARWLPDGNIEYLGRLDFQVKLRGYRIELTEIEAAVRQQPGVRDCVVALQEYRPGDKRLVAYLLAEPSGDNSRAELRSRLKQHLPDYMIPAVFVYLSSFPQTSTGKLDRQALPAPETALEPTHRPMNSVLPRDALEQMLTALWEEILSVPGIGIHDNFFELGGHSLLAVRLLGRLGEPSRGHIPLSVLFQHQTISELARYLRQLDIARPPETLVPLYKLPHSENRLPLFCIHPAGGNVLCYIALARALGHEQPCYGLQSLPGQRDSRADADTFESVAASYIVELKKTQPSGPYHLLGWSYGGTLAFAMAHKLRQDGQEVALLMLVDSFEPEFARTFLAEQQQPTESRMRTEFLCDLLQRPVDDAEISSLAAESPDLPALLRQLRDRGRFPDDMDAGQLTAGFEMFCRNLKLLADYRPDPRPYPGPMVLLRASESPHPADRDHGWSRVCAQPPEVITVAGNHYSIMAPANVRAVAEQLAPRLSRRSEP